MGHALSVGQRRKAVQYVPAAAALSLADAARAGRGGARPQALSLPAGGAVTHGVQLTSSNTGIPAGTTLTTRTAQPAGSHTDTFFTPQPNPFWQVTSSGTFTRCKFTETVIVYANNVSFIDCEFVGNITIANAQGVSLLRCHGYNSADMSNLTADDPKGSDLTSATFTECLFDGPTLFAGGHVDGMQAHGVNGFTALRCAWNMGSTYSVGGEVVANAAMFFDGDNSFGGHQNVLLEDCYLNGGGNQIYLRNGLSGNATTDNIRYRNLYLGPDFLYARVVNNLTGGIAEWSAYTYPGLTPVTL